jgi:hypothetical protein
MLNGGQSIEQIYSTREVFDAVPSIQASMTKSTLQDLTACLHYSDDWECDDDWGGIYDYVKVEADASSAQGPINQSMVN